MAFGMKNVSKIITDNNPEILKESTSKEVSSLIDYVEIQKEYYDLTPLILDKEKMSELNFKTLAELEEAKMQSTSNTIKIMNVVRYSAPILKFVCEKEKDDEKRSILFVQINERLISYAKKVMTLWNIPTDDNSNNWIVNVLVRTFANSFTEEMWLEESDIEKLAMKIHDISEMTIENKYDRSYFQPLTTSVKLAIVKAATPIYKSVNQYPFLKNKETKDEEIKKIMTFIVNKTTHAISILTNEVTEEKDRVMLFKVMLEEAANIFSDVWEKNGILFNEKYKNSKEKELTILKESNPQGIQIFEYVCKKFNEQYDSIINLASVKI